MMDGKYADIVWHNLPKSDLLHRSVRDAILTGYGDYLRSGDPHEVLQSFDQFRILCALREGPFGVVAMNLLVEEFLRKANLINPGSKWYPGRPVLIARNDYRLQLFNGDVGIILPDPEAGNDLRAFFPAPEGKVRKFHPLRLPQHETVYAMTVHKSQGSEFNHILLLLPDRDSPVLTRELIYTGITRAKEHVEILGNKNVFRKAVSRRIERTSGLRDALWLPRPLTS
jgi:exodeoxyribonuclease V alpha subunit